jgi:hypothetical protein
VNPPADADWGAPGVVRGTFAGLADALGPGFSERDCQIAAATGRLGTLIGLVEKRKRAAAGPMTGWQALAELDRREHDPSWLLLELRLRDRSR